MRDPKTIVYGSSYDRGLEHLLKMWSEILKEVPDAKLRIFYGWDLFDRIMANNPERMAWKEKMQELMKQEGITELGRISHGAVQVEMENAGIWAYPTHFGEISCITAMKAQAYGAEPIVINYAALEETVRYGDKIDGDIYEPEIREAFKKSIIGALKVPIADDIREEMMNWAKNQFPWSKVAKQWSDEFKSAPNLDKQVQELMDNNQALDAWNLVKDTDYPKKDRVYLKVRHAFEPEAYEDYYSNDLVETPVPEEVALNCITLAPRFKWVVEEIGKQRPKEVLDLGCADGYLCLTLAKRGFNCIGYNLHEPSIILAEERAKKNNLSANFICDDLFNASLKCDAVVLMEVLEHLPDPKKAIDHCMSLVNEGGSFYLSTPSPMHVGIEMHLANPEREGWDDGKPSGHLKLYSKEELMELLKDYKIKQFKLDEDNCWLVEIQK